MNSRSVGVCCFLALGAAVACRGGFGDNQGGDGDENDTDASLSDATAIDAPTAFSFFVTSLDTMRAQSGRADGFGGNLGGLEGADHICQTAATNVGYGHKTWRAFLSVYNNGTPIHAIERIGNGPWYDRNGRLIASDTVGLLQERPAGDRATVSDLPDEHGTPLSVLGDSHDVLTGSNPLGRLDGASAANTCDDWTSALGEEFAFMVRCGHSWPSTSGMSWITAHTLRGCAPGVNLVQNGPGTDYTVGAGGGWGAIYCFALEP